MSGYGEYDRGQQQMSSSQQAIPLINHCVDPAILVLQQLNAVVSWQAELQQFVQNTQQQAVVMQTIEKFTDMCFKKCVGKPGTSVTLHPAVPGCPCQRWVMRAAMRPQF